VALQIVLALECVAGCSACPTIFECAVAEPHSPCAFVPPTHIGIIPVQWEFDVEAYRAGLDLVVFVYGEAGRACGQGCTEKKASQYNPRTRPHDLV
jgi:hypothetical protein